jgi:hypothetical protein
VSRVPFKATALKAGVGRLTHTELAAIANIRDAAVRQRYQVEPAPGLLLRFQRYTRTADELQDDGPYTGAGAREHLGQAVTDEQGNYIFRFRHVAAGEGLGEAAASTLRPDLIVQVLGTGLRVCFEAAPYDNVANLRRIDLCVPATRAHANRAFVGGSPEPVHVQRKRAAEAALSHKAQSLDLHVHAHSAHATHAAHATTGRGSFVLGGLSDHGFGRQHQ